MPILVQIEIVVRIKCSFPRVFGWAVVSVPIFPPHRAAGEEIRSDTVRQIGYYKLRFGYSIRFEILETVVIQFDFLFRFFSPLRPCWANRNCVSILSLLFLFVRHTLS